jgi:acyl-CoA hydrolase
MNGTNQAEEDAACRFPAAREPGESVVIMTELIMPAQANPLNNLMGGQMMHFMDIAGALACRRHAGHEVVTVTVERIEFRYPVRVGEVITLTAKLVWAGRTSMKVKIEVGSENIRTHTSRLTNTAFFTYVALDEDRKPIEVPRLVPRTPTEKADFEREQERYEQRKKKKSEA